MEIAEILHRIGAVKIRKCPPEEPFRFSSGLLSPVYIDCRLTNYHPDERKRATQLMAEMVKTIGTFDVIAGGESAGIPIGRVIADILDLPFIYVRKKPKGYGRQNQIEGTDEPLVGKKILLVEDLSSTGHSKKNFIDALKRTGAVVEHCAVYWSYGRVDEVDGVKIHALCLAKDAFKYFKEKGHIDEETKNSLMKWLEEPEEWARSVSS